MGSGEGPASRRDAAAGSGTAPETGRTTGRLEVLQIRESWRIDDEWWREPVSRRYFEVVLETGRRTVLYRDLVGGGWYRQRG